MEVTEDKLSKEQGELRKGKGYVGQMFVIKMIVKEH